MEEAQSIHAVIAAAYQLLHALSLPPHEADAGPERLAHAERTAQLLARWGGSPELQAAGLLHKFMCMGSLSSQMLAQHCGERTAFLCEQYRRLLHEPPPTQRGRTRARRRIQLFVAAYCDPELAFLAVAEAWARFQAIREGESAQRAGFLEEGRHILGPFLEMLGMQALKDELDSWLGEVSPVDPALTEALVQWLEPHLPDVQVVPQPYHRAGDAPARRDQPPAGPAGPLDIVLVAPTEEACYRLLYRLHRIPGLQPVEGALMDQMGHGRLNGRRGLLTACVATHQGRRYRVHFRLCTPEMEEVNQWGLAALHMRRRLALSVPGAWWNRAAEGYAQIQAAPMGDLPDYLWVFSPQGQLFRFHRGCTVVDFAYALHTDLAEQCQRFYINDEQVAPNTVLHHLDLVALELDPRAPGPQESWLNAARTTRARTAIARYLRRRRRGADQGQRILDRRHQELSRYYGFNIPEHRLGDALAQAMRHLQVNRTAELLAEVAAGHLNPDRILHPLFAGEILRQVQVPAELGLRPHQLQLAQCCRPRIGDDIVGIPYQRHGKVMRLRIHRQGCERLRSDVLPMPLQWRLQPDFKTLAQLEVTAFNEDGLLGDALACIYQMLPRVTLHRVEATARHGTAHMRFTLEAESETVVQAIADALAHLPGRQVADVRPMRLPPSEIEGLLNADRAFMNPYTRLPVSDREMFFGRTRELTRLTEWLLSNVGNIWLVGQKRVGKTSLLLHLKRHHLQEQGFVPVYIDCQLLGNPAHVNLFFELASLLYGELQADPRVGELGPPLRALFQQQPAVQLIQYLRSVQGRLGTNRLVLLLDEFSRTSDAYAHGQLDRSFFDGWRGLLQEVTPAISVIAVVQQKAWDQVRERARIDLEDPCWQLMELGETLVLRPLEEADVRRLIEWPMRNFLTYSPDIVAYVARLTGSSPFVIQAFCRALVSHLTRNNRREVQRADIDAVRGEFLASGENLFAHYLDMIRGGVGSQVCFAIAQAAVAHGDAPVAWEALRAALPHLEASRIQHALDELCRCDILAEAPARHWRFVSLLFAQWCALYGR
ncbi:MAG: hypothetical protein KatS3mg050_0376 [Litorilinea sp.]|nr:MAG: hypothetical protein KatS3mg050_0376 [Litorilinea sp.]